VVLFGYREDGTPELITQEPEEDEAEYYDDGEEEEDGDL
jgi:hypothetical protein